MSTTKDFHDFALGELLRIGEFSTRKMMGEYILYKSGVIVGGFYDNRLLLKETTETLKYLKNAERVYPYEGSKTLMVEVEDIEDTFLMQKIFGGAE